MATRRTEVLTAAAAALDEGTDPFSGGWLGEHEVTSDECASLAQQLAIGARLVAFALDNPRTPEGAAVLMSMARGLG